jgi:hypothetical protein
VVNRVPAVCMHTPTMMQPLVAHDGFRECASWLRGYYGFHMRRSSYYGLENGFDSFGPGSAGGAPYRGGHRAAGAMVTGPSPAG